MLSVVGSDALGVRRFGWVSLAVAALAAAISLAPWSAADPGAAAVAARRRAVIDFWQAHPDLAVDDTFAARFIPPADLADGRERGRILLASSMAPTRAERRATQAQLDELTAGFWATLAARPAQRLGLAREAGWLQLGWLTHPLLHESPWLLALHLIFFLALAPLVEALYGRLVCVLFCATVATVAGVAHFVTEPDTSLRLTGLAGTAAGCGGLFVVRFAWRPVQVQLWLGVTSHVFSVPGYLWAALPAAALGLLVHGGDARPTPWLIACAVGAGTALLLGISGIERRLRQGRDDTRRRLEPNLAPGLAPYRDILRRFDDTYEALNEVARQALDERNDGAAALAVDRLVTELLARADGDGIRRIAKEFGARIPAAGVSAATAAALAEMLEEHDPWTADALYASLAERGAAPGEPFLRAALLNLRRLQRPDRAGQWCERLLDAADCPAELRDRAGALLAEANREALRWAHASRSERPRTGPTPVGEVEHQLSRPGDLELGTADEPRLRTAEEPEDP